MRWILVAVLALVLLPIAWKLLAFATGAVFGLLHLVVLLAVVIFLIGLVRRMLLLR